MYFPKVLVSAAAGLFAATAAASTNHTTSGFQIKARSEVAPDILKRIDEDCLTASLKRRSLQPRDEKKAGLNELVTGRGDDELKTEELTICIGVAVSGTYEDDGDDKDNKFLAHLGAGYPDGTWNKFKDAVQGAKDGGLGELAGYMVIADPDAMANDPMNDPIDISTVRGNNDKVKGWMKDLVGADPKVDVHDAVDSWEMELKGDDNEYSASKDFI